MGSKILTLIMFSLSISILAFFYGYAARHWDLWPNTALLEAEVAFKALEEKSKDSLTGTRPTDFEYFVDSDNAEPFVSYQQNGRDYGDKLILVNGGVFQHHRYCPTFGCLAWIMDRNGKVLHTWEVDEDKIWKDIKGIYGFNSGDQAYPLDLKLYDNGDLLVSYQAFYTYPFAIGMAKFDKDSNLLWSQEKRTHHWFSEDEAGLFYAPSLQELKLPYRLGETMLQIDCHNQAMFEDTVAIMNADTQVIESFSVIDTLVDADYAGLVFEKDKGWSTKELRGKENIFDSCDPTHANSVVALSKADADQYPSLNAGDLLISMRNINAIMIVDRQSKKLKWLTHGRTVLQHGARFYKDNKIIVLDNQGGKASQGGARIVSIDLDNDELDVIFPTDQTPTGINFTSFASGDIRLSGDKSTLLVSLTPDGRVIEIDLNSRKRVWEYTNNHDTSKFANFPISDPNGRLIGRFSVHTAQYITPRFEMNNGNTPK